LPEQQSKVAQASAAAAALRKSCMVAGWMEQNISAEDAGRLASLEASSGI